MQNLDFIALNSCEYQNLVIGITLQEIGFCYAGLAEMFQINLDLYLETYHDYHFYSSKNEIFLDVVCDNLLYFYPLDFEGVAAKEVLILAKNAIDKKLDLLRSINK